MSRLNTPEFDERPTPNNADTFTCPPSPKTAEDIIGYDLEEHVQAKEKYLEKMKSQEGKQVTGEIPSASTAAGGSGQPPSSIKYIGISDASQKTLLHPGVGTFITLQQIPLDADDSFQFQPVIREITNPPLTEIPSNEDSFQLEEVIQEIAEPTDQKSEDDDSWRLSVSSSELEEFFKSLTGLTGADEDEFKVDDDDAPLRREGEHETTMYPLQTTEIGDKGIGKEIAPSTTIINEEPITTVTLTVIKSELEPPLTPASPMEAEPNISDDADHAGPSAQIEHEHFLHVRNQVIQIKKLCWNSTTTVYEPMDPNVVLGGLEQQQQSAGPSSAQNKKPKKCRKRKIAEISTSSMETEEQEQHRLPPMPTTPAKSEEQLRRLNLKLDEDESFKNDVFQDWSRIGGRNAGNCTNRIMQLRIMDGELKQRYNWEGRQGRTGFATYRSILHLLYSAVRVKFVNATEHEMENSIKTWIKNGDPKVRQLEKKLKMEKREPESPSDPYM